MTPTYDNRAIMAAAHNHTTTNLGKHSELSDPIRAPLLSTVTVASRLVAHVSLLWRHILKLLHSIHTLNCPPELIKRPDEWIQRLLVLCG